MSFRIITRGAPRPIRSDFRCPEHGVFTALVDSGTDEVLCPLRCDDGNWCGLASPWSPSLVPMRMKRVEAVRGNHEKAQHKGWCDTSNLEEGQEFDDWQADRDRVAEELRKDLVTEMVRSDR